LTDDPYPRAEVTDWPDQAPTDADAERVESVAATLRRVLAMANELGEPVAPASTVELADEAILSSYRLAAMAPVGPLDRLAFLAASTVGERLDRLTESLAEVEAVLATRLGGG
jgi:Lon protease-like protein